MKVHLGKKIEQVLNEKGIKPAHFAKEKDLLATQQFAGYESIRQTMVYTHQDPKEIKEKMRAMDDIMDAANDNGT
jgi:hypothetical protein